MPSWRKLWVKATESLDLDAMPDDFTRLLWLLLPLIACRAGRGIDNPSWIKGKAMPLREDVTQDQIEAAMCWYADRHMVRRYTVDGRRFFAIQNWTRYQGRCEREAPSNYPEPPQEEDKSPPNATHDQLTTNSRLTQEKVASSSCLDVDVDVDVDVEIDVETSKKSTICAESGPGEGSAGADSASAGADAYRIIRQAWIEFFPEKPRPRLGNKTLLSKAKTRMKSKFFQEKWEAALRRASKSAYLKRESWFDLSWFLKNDDNWEKCLNGKYDGRAQGRDSPSLEWDGVERGVLHMGSDWEGVFDEVDQ